MPTATDKTHDRLVAAEETFRAALTSQYDLESEYIDAFCKVFRETVSPLLAETTTTRRARGSSKPKKLRKKSAYNVYVREMMMTEGIKSLDHKKKMGAIAGKWRELTDDDKVPYTEKATAENDKAEEASAEEATA